MRVKFLLFWSLEASETNDNQRIDSVERALTDSRSF